MLTSIIRPNSPCGFPKLSVNDILLFSFPGSYCYPLLALMVVCFYLAEPCGFQCFFDLLHRVCFHQFYPHLLRTFQSIFCSVKHATICRVIRSNVSSHALRRKRFGAANAAAPIFIRLQAHSHLASARGSRNILQSIGSISSPFRYWSVLLSILYHSAFFLMSRSCCIHRKNRTYRQH